MSGRSQSSSGDYPEPTEEMVTNTTIVGKCMTMCPQKEIDLRYENKRIHVLEALPETKKNRYLKPDPNRMVKEFGRSSAGAIHMDVSLLRPTEVLDKTVSYLIAEVVPKSDVPWNVVYDFVFDRLRAVRQELVIQQIAGPPKITMIEKMVLFHVYAAYKMSTVEFRLFDPVINRQHLDECLNVLMNLYDIDQEERAEMHRRKGLRGSSPRIRELYRKRRGLFEAIFILHNLSKEAALQRAATIPNGVKETKAFNDAFECGLNYGRQNYYAVLSHIPLMYPFLAMAISQHIPLLHLNYLRVLNYACSSSQLSVPFKYLAKVLTPFEPSDSGECYISLLGELLNCDIVGWNAIRFDKSNRTLAPDMSKEVLSRIQKCHWSAIEDKYRHSEIGDLISCYCEGTYDELEHFSEHR